MAASGPPARSPDLEALPLQTFSDEANSSAESSSSLPTRSYDLESASDLLYKADKFLPATQLFVWARPWFKTKLVAKLCMT